MIRKIIKIDADKCTGCGLCASACHEGAIGMVDGKAKLIREDYCDGFGDCLPACPAGAITFEEREALAYDEEAVKENHKQIEEARQMEQQSHPGCPGSKVRVIRHECLEEAASSFAGSSSAVSVTSELMQWPCQIKLMPLTAPYYDGAKLLIVADCTAYAYGNFHKEFIKGKVTVIGCPKLDDVDYSEKLTQIITNNNIKSVTILRMEVPCCGGLERAAIKALQNSGKFIPWQVVTISIEGKILD